MARKRKRDVTTFSLSFLDVMACGFGAVTLLFLILKHDVVDTADPNQSAEINQLQEEILIGEKSLVELVNSLKVIEQKIVKTQGLSTRVVNQIGQTQREISLQKDPEQEIKQLKIQVDELEKEASDLESQGRENDLRAFIGQGDRQYLTGLKLGGKRVMILLDASSSMLSDSIVNIIRIRNQSEQTRRNANKWVRAVTTAEWIVAQLPPESTFQLYTFNTQASPVLTDTKGLWLDPTDTAIVDSLFTELRRQIPEKGTSLVNAFSALNDFEKTSDNLFLITDGLPTQGVKKPNKNTVSGRERVKFFNQSVESLPSILPVNTILFPMEGDPQAAAAFWQLAIASSGSFLSPSKDWP